jgi:hypothetical protein
MSRTHATPWRAGFAYFAAVFALGFALGTLRVLWLTPAVGETSAIVAKQPFMLGASWLVAGWLLRRSGISATRDRAVMGGFAFVLLMAAEIALGVTVFEQSPGQSLADALVLPGLIGLVGQVVFGLMPLFVGRR